MVNLVVFGPGTDVLGYTIDPALGYPAVIVFLDGGDPRPDPEPAPIQTALVSAPPIRNVWRNAEQFRHGCRRGGPHVSHEPAGRGLYPFGTFAVSQPDADSDGLENQLDTPWTQNVGDPRVSNSGRRRAGHVDPTIGAINHDEDSDCSDGRTTVRWHRMGNSTMNQSDTDFDGIGDNCDPNPARWTG
jgi:hypothetical protein